MHINGDLAKSTVEETSVNIFIPRESLGGIKLGEPIDSYSKRNDYEIVEESCGEDWYYFKGGDISVFTSDGIIDTIACVHDVMWNNVPLIGMKILDFVNIFQLHVDSCERLYLYEAPPNRHTQYMHTFIEPLGLCIWCWRKRIIKVVLCSGFMDE